MKVLECSVILVHSQIICVRLKTLVICKLLCFLLRARQRQSNQSKLKSRNKMVSFLSFDQFTLIDSTSCKKPEASKFGGLERLPNKIFLLFVGISSNQITSILGRSASMFMWLNCRCSSKYTATPPPKESLSLLIILQPVRCSSSSEIFSSSHVSFKERMWVCTHCRTRVVHLACYISCGYLDDKSVSLSYWLEEQNLAQDLVIHHLPEKLHLHLK